MLTAEQLYEILTHRDDTGVNAGEQQKNKAANALYSLWGSYKAKKVSASDYEEYAFSTALTAMMDKAERLIQKKADRDSFVELMKHETSQFRTAYEKLPETLRGQEQMRETFDVVSKVRSTEKTAYDWQMAVLIERFCRDHETILRLRSGLHPYQTADDPMPEEELQEFTEASKLALEKDLASILAMDNLRKTEGLKAALDPAKRKKERDAVRKQADFQAAFKKTALKPSSAEGLSSVFRDIDRHDLAEYVASTVKETPALREAQQAAEKDLQRDLRILAESAYYSYEAVRQLRDGIHPAQQDPMMTDEDLDAMKKANLENLKASVATLLAMDEFRKMGDFVSATDPELLQAASDWVMETGGETLDTEVAAMATKAGDTPDLRAMFKKMKRPELSKQIAEAKESVLQREKQEVQAGETEPEKTAETQTEPDTRGYSPYSPVMRFKAKLKELKAAAGDELSDSPLYEIDGDAFQQGLKELFALRDLAAKAPLTPVTDEQVRERERLIMSGKASDSKFYQAVLRIQSTRRLAKVVDAIQGGEPLKQFKEIVKKAAGLQTVKEKQEKTTGTAKEQEKTTGTAKKQTGPVLQ